MTNTTGPEGPPKPEGSELTPEASGQLSVLVAFVDALNNLRSVYDGDAERRELRMPTASTEKEASETLLAGVTKLSRNATFAAARLKKGQELPMLAEIPGQPPFIDLKYTDYTTDLSKPPVTIKPKA